MDSRVQKMAEVIINYSCEVKPGDRVLIRGMSPIAEPLVAALYQEGLRAGGKVVTYVHLSDENALAIAASSDTELLAEPNPMLQLMYETCDVIVRIEATENTLALADYPQSLQAARMAANGALMSIQMVREGNGELRRCTTQFPTQAYAQASGMSLLQYADFVFSACKLHLDDPVAAWKTVDEMQEKLVGFLAGKKRMTVRGKNIDMEMSIEGRSFLNASGKRNFPDGEIFTGPVEDSVNGWVQFTYPALYHGNEVIGARLEFKDGLVVRATADKGEEYLNATLDTDAGSRRLGEFAIGTNKEIQRFTGSILFDEKIGGTVHMALGNGYPESGSTNLSAIHWDMICDMRDGGEIRVDDMLFYQNGEFVV